MKSRWTTTKSLRGMYVERLKVIKSKDSYATGEH